MRNEKGLWERLAQGADLPLGSLPGNSLVEIVAGKRVLIEHHFGICAYSRCEVCVKIKPGTVQINGANLELLCIDKQQLVIGGRVDSVSFNSGVR